MISPHYDMINIEQNDKTFDLFYDAEKAGFMEYNVNGNILEIIHTEVFKEFGGKDLGLELVKAAVELAEKNNYKIVASCPYAKKIIDATPEFKVLLAK
ncbi:GNAT family N-acetyltransferase [Chryseobacterium gotjawalense]|uniref:GNAT family N-acetyltransferase n=1 Tax=Chryseobacterium gotjawalense TaxID=3042315 RepID=A0ABY8RC32_9FLAO|nr:GNAT family N-acetyltransferase [Chryseobacterium sp. wdc7]WHF51540.1 GNAT family N-acetyltransferase [Chryseobacterium sp. wdc7]